jgi:hypothetical protein
MLADSADRHSCLRYVSSSGTTDEIIDMNDFGELMPILKTSVPRSGTPGVMPPAMLLTCGTS